VPKPASRICLAVSSPHLAGAGDGVGDLLHQTLGQAGHDLTTGLGAEGHDEDRSLAQVYFVGYGHVALRVAG